MENPPSIKHNKTSIYSGISPQNPPIYRSCSIFSISRQYLKIIVLYFSNNNIYIYINLFKSFSHIFHMFPYCSLNWPKLSHISSTKNTQDFRPFLDAPAASTLSLVGLRRPFSAEPLAVGLGQIQFGFGSLVVFHGIVSWFSGISWWFSGISWWFHIV